MATKYSDAIRIRETKSAYNIQTEEHDEWKNFIPNEQFNSILTTVLGSVSNKIVDEHKSFWLEGTYGTGKSHAAAVIKHLLCDPVEEIEEYVKQEFAGDKFAILRETLFSLRKKTRLFPVTMYGHCSITHKDDLSLQIQTHVVQALQAANLDIVVRTDFDNYIANIEKNPAMWDHLIASNAELASYAPDRKKLIKDLRSADTAVLALIKKTLRETGFNVRLQQENLCKWFFEVQDELAENTPYKGILLLWDEFTDVMLSDIGPSLLVDLQELAEVSQLSTNNSYFFHIAHPSALDSLKADERTKTMGRYRYMHYNMEPVSAFKIMSRKFIHEDVERNEEFFEYHLMTGKYFSMMSSVYEKYAESSNNPQETIEDMKQLFPVHPGTANLATYYAREAGSSSRSVFEFLGSNPAIREFLDSEEHFKNGDMITADYLWDFVLDEFNNKVNKYGVVTERYNSYRLHVQNKGAHYSAVFKVILLLNALNNLASNDTVTPSEENIRNMFACTPIGYELDEILNWINTQGVVQRSPQGIYEIRFSALDTKEIEQFKQQLLSSDYKFTWQILKYGDTATKEFDKILKGVNRPFQYGFFSEDTNEYTLLNKIENGLKASAPYELYFALLFARSPQELSNIKTIASNACQDERFQNVAFFVFDTPMKEQDFERFIEYQANALGANKHGYSEQTKSHTENAKAIIVEWIKTMRTGISTIYLKGENFAIAAHKLASTINSSIAPLIFSKGAESVEIVRLKAPATCWVKQHSKGTADNVLSFSTKDDIVERCTGPAKHMALLLQDSVDDNLQFKPDCDVNHPLLVVSKFVKTKIDHADKQVTFNFADKFRDLMMPPYGIFPSHSGYGMLAFALRPYIDNVFDTNGKPITAQRMLELIYETFKIWESGSSSKSGKVDVKFETKEEGAIAKGLIHLFSLNKLRDYKDVTSLTDTRWALRNGYCSEIGYPLWALKYSPAMQEKQNKEDLNKMIDNIITIYTESGIKDPHLMVETDKQITSLKFDLLPLLNRESKNFNKGFHDFLMSEENVKLKEEEYSQAVQYIRQHMEQGVGLWTEKAVIEQLRLYRISTIESKPVVPNPSIPNPPFVPGPKPQINKNKQSLAKAKIGMMNEASAKRALNEICELGYDVILDIILK